jgi:hypothetical protein
MALAVQLSNEAESFKPILTSPSLGEYSKEQKEFFDNLIESSDAVGMKVLQLTLDEREFSNLYHSFQKGEKGKYQTIIDNLCAEGQKLLDSTLEAIREAISSGDDMMLRENIEGLTNDERACIANLADPETRQIIEEFE